MGKIKSFRQAGWAQLSGQWTPFAVVTLVYILISTAISSLEGLSIISTILIIPVTYSYSVLFLDNKRAGAPAKVESLFVGYQDFTRIFGTALLEYVYIFLWTLLLIVPGIIKGLSYSQTAYVLKDNPELSYNAAIERSMAMMDGHKWEFFLLCLSFIGWALVVIVTLGIASIWVTPYTYATFANYYEYVKAEYENKIAA